jgi:hypothetical protein
MTARVGSSAYQIDAPFRDHSPPQTMQVEPQAATAEDSIA